MYELQVELLQINRRIQHLHLNLASPQQGEAVPEYCSSVFAVHIDLVREQQRDFLEQVEQKPIESL